MCHLRKNPRVDDIQHSIFNPLSIKLLPQQIQQYKEQLVIEGLIIDHNPDDIKSKIEITPEGYKAIDFYGDYVTYKNEERKYQKTLREIEYLKKKNIRLKNISLVIGFISFILGVLLSTPIKNILKQWVLSDG